MTPEMLKGHLDGLVLAILEPEPQHGFGVIEQLKDNSGGTLDLPTGTIYPALHRLERTGLVTATWTVHNGHRRRVYALTTLGRAKLATYRAQWRGFADTIERIVQAPA
ncbi:PadR family transcriptional regulator [Allorhizocola rhizosphaerae]|uniref:PadR family transcriptional regulator n=1 Tax=Allorhizocola rhizosphaerae TaxID=1872709 RepID=UPI000E3C3541|nr:helix-turn-helix transcriptional regulator [Allorhizocola rhizosphaerae]